MGQSLPVSEGETPSAAGSACVADDCGGGRQHFPMSELPMAPSPLSLLTPTWGNSLSLRAPVLKGCKDNL